MDTPLSYKSPFYQKNERKICRCDLFAEDVYSVKTKKKGSAQIFSDTMRDLCIASALIMFSYLW